MIRRYWGRLTLRSDNEPGGIEAGYARELAVAWG